MTDINKFLESFPKPFKDLDEFLRYCEIHSKSQRAQFSTKHAILLYELAGEEYDALYPETRIHEEDMKRLLSTIREKDPNILYN